MNRRDIKNDNQVGGDLSKILNKIDKYRSTKTIYIVKYKEVHRIPNANITKNNTYELLALEDLDDAKEYMDTAHDCIINENTACGAFKVILDTTTNKPQLTKNGNAIIYERRVKLVGTNDINSHTKSLTFTVEEIKFKSHIIG